MKRINVARRERVRSLRAWCCAVTALLCTAPLKGQAPPIIEAVVNAPLSQVWRIFTTAEGHTELGAVAAEVDLRVGGYIRLRDGVSPGSATTLEEEILAFDPERMLATRVVQISGISDQAALRTPWTVLYFNSIAASSTHIRIVGLGYDNSPVLQLVQQYLAQRRRAALDLLVKRYRPGCAHCGAPP